MSKNIVLIGMMGSGKSTVGRQLSEKLHRQFMDTDETIEKLMGCSIADLFKLYGEAYFRNLEQELSLKLTQLEDAVISTGGGFILNPEVLKAIKHSAIIIYLKASIDELTNRLGDSDETRPMLKTNNFETLLEMRDPIYIQSSNHIIVVDHKNVDEIIKEILEKICEF